MVKRKPNEPSQTDAGIFSSLFGSAAEETAGPAASLFSDNNPFRRKPDATNSPVNGGSENHDTSEEKKRKRKKEKTPALDSDTVIEASEKKKKKKKKKEGSDEGGREGKDLELDVQEGDGKKKRKREELEKDWEEKKYGMVEGGEEGEGEGIVKKTVGSKRKALDNPADMLVTKEGFDDEDKLLRTIFVGNLPLKVKKKTLIKEFTKFGEVESVRIRSVPLQDTKKPRKGAILSKQIDESADSVNAYVVFKDEQAAQASLSHNMTVVEGNHIRVDRACPPRKKLKSESATLYDNKKTVFVGNLPFDVKDEELYQLFCGMPNLKSSIEAVRVVRDPHLNVGKGIAYVLFKTREAANLVVRKRYLKLRDRELRLSHAKADATPSKRPNTPSKRPDTPSKRPDTPSKRPNSSPAQAPGTPAKKPVSFRLPSSSTFSSNKRPSYQGVRATKPTAHKKSHGGEKPKGRLVKRPSVAARRAKTKSVEDGPPKQAGSKRKLDSRTPDSSLRNKKAQKKR